MVLIRACVVCCLAFFGMLFLAGCHAPEPPLRLGTNLWLGYEPFYTARSRGWLPESHIKLVEYPSTAEVLRAFQNQALDAAALTLDEALLLSRQDPEITIGLILDFSNGADSLLTRSELTHLNQLSGRKIGVDTLTLGSYMLSRALERANLTLQQVEVVHLPIDQHLRAFEDKQVDAVITFEPVKSKLIQQHQAKELFSSLEIPGEIVDVLVYRKKDSQRNGRRAQLKMLMEGWFKTLAVLQQNPSSVLKNMQARQKLPAAELNAALKTIHFPDVVQNRFFLGSSSPLIQTSLRMEEVLYRLHLVPTLQKIPVSLDNSLVFLSFSLAE